MKNSMVVFIFFSFPPEITFLGKFGPKIAKIWFKIACVK